ncbi:MAG: DUF2975 domain-containing protein [Alphaproteobacteria bacterium]|nr:DUF2975 domain-containing protein [Alphaproteobacteria bacterium]
MTPIQKVSRLLLTLFNILIVGLPLLTVTRWFFIETKITDVSPFLNFFGLFEQVIQTPEGFVNVSTVPWSALTKFIGFSSDIMALLPLIFGLFVLKALFRNYQKGEIFSTTNARHYRILGALFFLDALLIKMLSNTLIILAVTLNNAPGHRCLNIQFGTPNMEMLFCGILVMVISWVMLEASKLHDDQKFII